MKKLLLFLTIFPLFTACAQKEKKQEAKDKTELERFDKSDLNFDEATRVITFKSNGKQVSGIVYENWENGQLMEETTVKDGKFNGIRKRWYEDGTIEAEAIFNNGELTFHKRYYQNGNLFQMAHMQNGMPKDTAKVFYPDGSLLSNYIFINGEYSDGICYNPSGGIINCDLINNGIRVAETNKEDKPKPEIIRNNITDQPIDGLLMKSYSDGAPWYHQCYKNGVMHGYAAAWHENGEIMYTTNYIDGKENGIQRQFYPNGHLEFEGSMKDNKQEGITKKYYENGQLSYDGMYKEGKEDGVCKGWYENGQLWFKKNAKDGNPVGVQKTWHENGQLKWEGKFGELTSQKCWDKDGKEVECD